MRQARTIKRFQNCWKINFKTLKSELVFDIMDLMEIGADIEALEEVLDACAETVLGCLSVSERSDRVAALTRLTAKLGAVRVAAVMAADAVDVGALNDQRNTANHVASRTHADPADTRFDVRIGRWLNDFPIIADAYASGALTTAHVDKIRLAHNPRVHAQMIEHQHLFVEWCTSCHFRDLDAVIAEWLLGADPDGAEPRHQQAATGLTVTPLPDGRTRISGLLDPLQAAALMGPVNDEIARIKTTEDNAGVSNSLRRRTLHAVMNLIGRGAARPNGTFARPRVNIVMSQRVYEDTLQWLADPVANDFPHLDRNHIDSKCEMIDGTPIHPIYALAATATAQFRRLVYDAKGRAIDVSIDSRRVPDWMRDATLVATNGRCANPVCDAPFEWLHADHIDPYSHTQHTRLDSVRPACGADNGWRGNDTSRGQWETPVDWEPDDDFDPTLVDDLEHDHPIRVAYELHLARQRASSLTAA